MALRSALSGAFAPSRTTARLALLGAAALLVATAPAIANGAAGNQGRGPDTLKPADLQEKAAYYDSRQDAGNRKVLQQRSAINTARPAAGVKALRQQLGRQGIVSIDPLTGTARVVQRLDGFLSGPSKASPRTVALNYVRSHPDVFGLSPTEVRRLVLRKDYVDIAGTHHLSFIQTVGGIPVFGNGLKAHVTKTGRLISVLGSPVANLPTAAAKPSLPAAKAREFAISNVGRSAKAAAARTRPEYGAPPRSAAATWPTWSTSRPRAACGWPGRP